MPIIICSALYRSFVVHFSHLVAHLIDPRYLSAYSEAILATRQQTRSRSVASSPVGRWTFASHRPPSGCVDVRQLAPRRRRRMGQQSSRRRRRRSKLRSGERPPPGLECAVARCLGRQRSGVHSLGLLFVYGPSRQKTSVARCAMPCGRLGAVDPNRGTTAVRQSSITNISCMNRLFIYGCICIYVCMYTARTTPPCKSLTGGN